MYSSTSELPTQVTSSLDDRDATRWMQTYNRVVPKDATPDQAMQARRKAWQSVKNAPSSFSFKIKASVDAIDKDKEIIDLQSIKQKMDSFIRYGGDIGLQHGNYHVGCIWAWQPAKDKDRDAIVVWGNLFGGDQVYDQTRKDFVNGRNSLSVAGQATQGRYQCDSRGCYTRRYVKQLLEISLCQVPANKYATMMWYNKKAKLTKSAGFTLNVDEYEIHKDYTACPVQALKKSLLDCGYTDVHARDDGVQVNMDPDAALGYSTQLMLKGYGVEVNRDGMLVRTRQSTRRTAFTKAYTKGWLDADGRVTGCMPADEFKALYEYGMIEESNGKFRFSGA